MSDYDTVNVTEEIGSGREEANLARGFPSPTQPKTGTPIDAFASWIVVWTLSEGEKNEPSAFSHQDGGESMWC